MPFPAQRKSPGSYRCSICSINYPPHTAFSGDCPACGFATTYFSNVFVSEDWLDLAEQAALAVDGPIPDAPPPKTKGE